MSRLRVLVLVPLLLLAGFGVARAADPFGAFIKGARPACAHAPAADCVSAVSAFLDSNANGRVELREIERAMGMARRSVSDKGSALNALERNITAVALMVLTYAGPAQVFANFDANGDGALSKAELFADFRIDRRPFGAIVKDPKSADWKRFAGRFGKVGFLLTDLLPPAQR